MSDTPRLPFDDAPPPPLVEVEYGENLSVAERAALFHEGNPRVMVIARERSLRVVRRGVRRGSIAMIWENLRYEGLVTHGDKYKLNNSYRAWYARELMRTTPELAGWFETRESPHDPEYHDKEPR